MRRISILLFLGIGVLITRRHFLAVQSTGSIEGVVLEQGTDRPLQHVTVTLTPGRDVADTDAEGHFRIDNVTSGRYRITPTLKGFVFSRSMQVHAIRDPGIWLQVSGNSSIRNLQIRMVKPGVITGRVLLPDGRPVPRTTTVDLLRDRYDDYGQRRLTPAQALNLPGQSPFRVDDRGQYRIYGIAPGEYYLRVISGLQIRVYFPGVENEATATPITVRTGEEVEVPILTARPNTEFRPFRFSYVSPDGIPIWGEPELSFTIMNMGTPFSYIVGGQNQINVPRTTSTIIARAGGMPYRPLFYSEIQWDAADSNSPQQLIFQRGVQVSGHLGFQNDTTTSPNIPGLTCVLRSQSLSVTTETKYPAGCIGQQYSKGIYRLELQGIPDDAYVLSATAGADTDILFHPIDLRGDTEIKVTFASDGGVITGDVTDSEGKKLSDAVVALVPDAPLRDAGSLYRSVISSPDGSFELHGIRPGDYHLFAWQELEGAGYRNAEFMKRYDEHGTPVLIEKERHLEVNLKILDETKVAQN